VLRIVRTRGSAIGAKVWTHGLRHTAITVAIEQGQKAGIGLDQIRHFSRHAAVTTMMLYRDERQRTQTQATLAAIVGAEPRERPQVMAHRRRRDDAPIWIDLLCWSLRRVAHQLPADRASHRVVDLLKR